MKAFPLQVEVAPLVWIDVDVDDVDDEEEEVFGSGDLLRFFGDDEGAVLAVDDIVFVVLFWNIPNHLFKSFGWRVK